MNYLRCLIFLFFAFKVHSQTESEVEKNFTKIKNTISSENNLKNIRHKLDSLQFTFKDRKNNYVDYFLNRAIDFDFNHDRIRVRFDLWEYQIDLVTKNDSIFFKSIKTEYYKKHSFLSINEKVLKEYLKKRNGFYKSTKSIKDLQKEISLDETFAMYCGDGMPITEEGHKIKNLVADEDIESLQKMLADFNCERQAFGVEGFRLLSKRKVEIPEDCKKWIEHIKQRNSELQICSGCITGIVEKIY
jgi:hypothetical protein